MRVGFIGLGSQGAPMARRIVDAGFPLTVWARRAETTAAFAETAAAVAESPRTLASVSDLVCICVVDDAGVGQVVDGKHGVLAGMQPGTTLAIHSTVNPATCRELAHHAEQEGISVIDAPVSGGGPAAAEGKLLIMTGGDEQVIARCTPVFKTFADTIVRLGDVGAGQLGKLVNNLVFTSHLGIAANAMELGAQLCLDEASLIQVLTRGSGTSFALNAISGMGTLERFGTVAGPLLRKDVRLIQEIAASADLALKPIIQAADTALMAMGYIR